MKKRNFLDYVPSELQECIWFFEWAQLHPLVKEYLIKHVNEGKRSKVNGHLLNLIGLRKGLPDYQLPIANRNWNGIWIEMKTRNKNKHKPDKYQDLWIEKLKKIRQYATYAYGFDEAISIVKDYLADKI